MAMRKAIAIGSVLLAAVAVWIWSVVAVWFAPLSELPWALQIDPQTGTWHTEDPGVELDALQRALDLRGWSARPGLYVFEGGLTGGDVARRVASGERETVRVVVPAHREIGVIAGSIASQLWVDSASVDAALRVDSMWWQIRPNTYDFYWETSAQSVAQRLVRESNAWWTPERRQQAAAWGLRPDEAVALASIVQEETASSKEAPRVAGLYLNRLRRGMLLQADPTLKFALGDWERRRLLDADKDVDSPYNTYRNAGLPPGPIRIPESSYVEAVLKAETHAYLYMCARADESGEHAFARTYSEHLRNARAYQTMLSRNGIYR